ncbi:GlsB/YeaQ/YmgE family stress response membrane protein [Dietzia sp.]|uniref:GlsB/YeaQ/YmgE family stress response membrane protein n=1 Tax=Dietzia sp. TaxID=1871616 RepID=UPI002FDA0483
MDTQTTFLAASSYAPNLGWIAWIIIGGLAGWIGSKIMKTDEQMGIFLNIVVGVIGGFVGGWILTAFGVDVAGGGWIFSFITCLVGALILLGIIKLIFGRRKSDR